MIMAMACLTFPAASAEYQFAIPGDFLVSAHGTLHVSAPVGWTVTTTGSDPDDASNRPPAAFPGSLITARNTTGAEMAIGPMDREERSVIALINERFGLDQDGNPLSQTLIMGAHAYGHVYFHRKTHSHRAHGDLETGPLLLSFVATVIDTNDWSEVLGIMESIRFEHHEDAQSGAADGASAATAPEP